ncbi:MAG: hypothetical protein MHM6MM_005381 [Cercozoa sp. M6MM]
MELEDREQVLDAMRQQYAKERCAPQVCYELFSDAEKLEPMARELVELLMDLILEEDEGDFHPLFLQRLFVDLVRTHPSLMPPLVGGAINRVFRTLEDYSREQRLALANLLSFHLSNLGPQWPWNSWAYCLEDTDKANDKADDDKADDDDDEQEEDVRRAFLRLVFAKTSDLLGVRTLMDAITHEGMNKFARACIDNHWEHEERNYVPETERNKSDAAEDDDMRDDAAGGDLNSKPESSRDEMRVEE